MLHFSYTFSRCLCQRKQNPKCLNHGGTFFLTRSRQIQYLHACYLNGSTRTSDTVPFGQEKPDLLGLMFLWGRKSQPYMDRCSFWAEKARPNWTNASKSDLLGPMLPLGRKIRPTWTSVPFGQKKPDLLGPVFPLGRKSQTYLDQCSFCAGKARPTWTNVPFGQEKPD